MDMGSVIGDGMLFGLIDLVNLVIDIVVSFVNVV